MASAISEILSRPATEKTPAPVVGTGWKIDIFEPYNLTPIATLYAETEEACVQAAYHSFKTRNDVRFQTTDLTKLDPSTQAHCEKCNEVIANVEKTSSFISFICAGCSDSKPDDVIIYAPEDVPEQKPDETPYTPFVDV